MALKGHIRSVGIPVCLKSPVSNNIYYPFNRGGIGDDPKETCLTYHFMQSSDKDQDIWISGYLDILISDSTSLRMTSTTCISFIEFFF